MADYVCRKHRCPNEGLVVEVAGEIGKPPECPKCGTVLSRCGTGGAFVNSSNNPLCGLTSLSTWVVV